LGLGGDVILGIPDGIFAGLVSGIVTLAVAIIGGMVQRRNAQAGNSATTQTKFYDNLMARVSSLETEVSELRERLEVKDREAYALKVEAVELKQKIKDLELRQGTA
jgi:predicted RNase H-like nuclease (RuvC/YqgF family)